MPARVLAVDPARPDGAAVAEAVAALRAGRLVGLPTETVYGLAADAWNADAVGAVFRAKRRPADNPLIVHLADSDDAGTVAAEMSPLARSLARRWWPGPLTLVLAARAELPSVTTGGLDTVAVRVPAHAVARAVLAAAALPLAAPSANRSGRPSPTTAQHVVDDLGDDVAVVLDAGETTVGVESTVVDARGSVAVILREGAISREQLGLPAAGPAAGRAQRRSAPGNRYRHYAPACRVEIAAAGTAAARALELAGAQRVGLLASIPPTSGAAAAGPLAVAGSPADASSPAGSPGAVVDLGGFTSAGDLARKLYAAFRDAERAGVDVLVVEAVEERDIGRAVMDRLRRAAAASTISAADRLRRLPDLRRGH